MHDIFFLCVKVANVATKQIFGTRSDNFQEVKFCTSRNYAQKYTTKLYN